MIYGGLLWVQSLIYLSHVFIVVIYAMLSWPECSLQATDFIWVRSRNCGCLVTWSCYQNCGCLVTWFCYQLIAKPGNETAAVSWPDPYWNHWWQHVSSEENEINTLGHEQNWQNVGNIFKCIFLGKIYLDKNFSEVCSHRSKWCEVSFIRTWVFD